MTGADGKARRQRRLTRISGVADSGHGDDGRVRGSGGTILRNALLRRSLLLAAHVLSLTNFDANADNGDDENDGRDEMSNFVIGEKPHDPRSPRLEGIINSRRVSK